MLVGAVPEWREIVDQITRIEDQGRHMVNNVCSTLNKRIRNKSVSLDHHEE